MHEFGNAVYYYCNTAGNDILLDYVFPMTPSAVVLHYIICSNRSLQLRLEKINQHLCLEREKEKKDNPGLSKETQLSLRRVGGGGVAQSGASGTLAWFPTFQTQTETHAHYWMRWLGPIWREQTPQGTCSFLLVVPAGSCGSGSNRAGAAQAPVAAGSQKSCFCSRNASRGLINWGIYHHMRTKCVHKGGSAWPGGNPLALWHRVWIYLVNGPRWIFDLLLMGHRTIKRSKSILFKSLLMLFLYCACLFLAQKISLFVGQGGFSSTSLQFAVFCRSNV